MCSLEGAFHYSPAKDLMEPAKTTIACRGKITPKRHDISNSPSGSMWVTCRGVLCVCVCCQPSSLHPGSSCAPQRLFGTLWSAKRGHTPPTPTLTHPRQRHACLALDCTCLMLATWRQSWRQNFWLATHVFSQACSVIRTCQTKTM